MERITQGINLKHAKSAKKVLQAQQLHNKLKKNAENVYDLLSCKKTHKEYKEQFKTRNPHFNVNFTANECVASTGRRGVNFKSSFFELDKEHYRLVMWKLFDVLVDNDRNHDCLFNTRCRSSFRSTKSDVDIFNEPSRVFTR